MQELPTTDIESGVPTVVVVPSSNGAVKKCAIYSGETCVLLFFVGLAALNVLFIVYGSMGLSYTSYSQSHEMCEQTHVWEFLLAAIIFSVSICGCVSGNELKSPIPLAVPILLTSATLSIWGLYEFYKVSCVSNLHDTLLYKVSYIYVFVSIGEFMSLAFISCCHCLLGDNGAIA